MNHFVVYITPWRSPQGFLHLQSKAKDSQLITKEGQHDQSTWKLLKCVCVCVCVCDSVCDMCHVLTLTLTSWCAGYFRDAASSSKSHLKSSVTGSLLLLSKHYRWKSIFWPDPKLNSRSKILERKLHFHLTPSLQFTHDQVRPRKKCELFEGIEMLPGSPWTVWSLCLQPSLIL